MRVDEAKTIADFRKDNGGAIRKICTRFALCREVGLLSAASVAIDSKFKAVNNRDRNCTRAKMERRRAQIEESTSWRDSPAPSSRAKASVSSSIEP